MFVHDLRNPPAAHGGVFAGFANVAYNNAANPSDTSLVTIPPTETTVNHGDPSDPAPDNQLTIHGVSQPGFFTLTPSGDLSTAGEIIGAGAAATSSTAPGVNPDFNANIPSIHLWTVTMHAAQAGVEQFTSSFDSALGHDTLLYDRDPAVPGPPSDLILFDPPTQLTISAAPAVSSITRVEASPTNASTVHYTVTFTTSVTGVDETPTFSNFALQSTGTISGAAITNITGSGTTYTVTVNTGTGSGTIELDLNNAGAIKDSTTAVGLAGVPVQGPIYTIDRTAPQLNAISLPDVNPTNASTVHFTVTFSENVTGVSSSDFTLAGTGISAQRLPASVRSAPPIPIP